MITMQQIYDAAVVYINDFLKKEFVAQGHHLTGALEASLDGFTVSRGNTDTLEGFAAYYSAFVEHGFPAKSASWKQLPFMINYFTQRGLSPKEAKAAAAATIVKWMKEGMSTQASKRFSSTGQRQGFIQETFNKHEKQIDNFMLNSFDTAIDTLYRQEPSEKI